MKNLSDERLEKLLTDYCEAEPEQSFVYDPEKKAEKVIPFALYRKQLVAAASLVLVTVLSITIYFLLGNKIDTPIAVAPSPQGATTPSSSGGESDGVIPDDPQTSTEAEEKPSGFLQLIESIFSKPAETQGSDTSPTNISPTEQGKGNTGGKPTESPSQSATESPAVKPTEPAHQPTQAPTQAPERPTQPPVRPTAPPTKETEPPTEGGGESPYPGEPETPVPTEGGEPGYENPAPIEFYGTFDISRLPAYDIVYCKIYDSSGRLMGDSNVYASSHAAEIIRIKDDTVIVCYGTPEGMIRSSDYYNYVFYDENGSLLAQGQEYVEV